MIAAIIFIVGLAVGSFLNVVVYRLSIRPKEGNASAFQGRSYCPHCRHQLGWSDLVPVFSFILLRGRCRYCGERISLQYPIVELSTATVFLLSFIFIYPGAGESATTWEVLNLLYILLVSSLLIILFAYDLRYYILPDKILIPAIVLAAFWYVTSSLVFGVYSRYEIVSTVIATILITLFFFSIFAVSKGRAMGFGDVKFSFFMGIFLGWPVVLAALFLAFLLGGVVGGFLMVMQKKGLRSQIPFGPFLVTGVLISLLWGDTLIAWYKDVFLL